MAGHRCFSRAVVQSARFLKMPLTTQALYFQLGIDADDDGIVEAFPVIRMVGAAEDDLRVLVTRGFVRILDEDLLTYITDWNENNSIRKDRYHSSVHHDLLVQILSGGDQVATKWQPNDSQTETNGKPKLSKDKSSEDKKREVIAPPRKEKEVGLREGNEENRVISPSAPQGRDVQQPDGHCAGGGGVFSEEFKEFLKLFPEATPGGSKMIAWDQWQDLNPDKAQEHELGEQAMALLRDRPELLPSYILGQYAARKKEKR